VQLSERELGLIASQPVCRLATINRNGSIHVVPLCPVVVDGVVYVDLSHATQSEANLRRDRRATVLFDEYSSNWDKLWGVQLRCTAEFLEDGSDEWRRAWAEVGVRYPQRAAFEWEPRMLVRLTPARKASWGTS
jgi:hypothetical protein